MGLYTTSTVGHGADCSFENHLGHVFGDSEGWLAIFVGRQSRFENPEARYNELTDIKQEFCRYPDQLRGAGEYLRLHGEAGLDCYFGVHLFESPGRRFASRATKWIQALWLDEDEGSYPESGPGPR